MVVGSVESSGKLKSASDSKALRQLVLEADCSQTPVEVCMLKSEKKSFQVVLIPPLEGVVVQATLEGFAALTAGFIVKELDLIPGEKHDKRMKTQNNT